MTPTYNNDKKLSWDSIIITAGSISVLFSIALFVWMINVHTTPDYTQADKVFTTLANEVCPSGFSGASFPLNATSSILCDGVSESIPRNYVVGTVTLTLPKYLIEMCAGGVCRTVDHAEVKNSNDCGYGYAASTSIQPIMYACNSFSITMTPIK
jgi:hypothetical protein